MYVPSKYNHYEEKWLVLGERALQRSKSLVTDFEIAIEKIKTYSKELIDKDLIRTISYNDIYKIHNLIVKNTKLSDDFLIRIYGVDSSLGSLERVGGFLLVPISASKIYIDIRIDDPMEHILIIDEDFEVDADIPSNVHDGLSPNIAYRIAELTMLNMEVSMLNKIFIEINQELSDKYIKTYVYLDGPIIDPPDVRYNIDGFNEYMENRAKTIYKIINSSKKPSLVCGFVKRIMGRQFYNELKRELEEIRLRPEFENDWTFLVLALGGILRSQRRNVVVYTKPLELTGSNIDLFRDYGVTVYYSYFSVKINDIVYNPYRLDIAIPTTIKDETIPSKELDWLFKEALYITFKTFIPGSKYPLPIDLAHTTCSIPKKDAKKLLQMIISKTYAEMIRKDITYSDYLHMLIQS